MTEEFDAQIAAKQKELEAYKLDLEAIKQQFIKDSSAFIGNWYEETAKSHVISEAANTLKIGKEKLSEMKAKVRDLKANSEKIATETLSNPSLWWHLNPENKQLILNSYEQYGTNKIPQILDKPLRMALGRLGAILEEYGFNVTMKPSHNTSRISWLDISTYLYSQPPVPYYPLGFDCNNEMLVTLKSYDKIFKKAFSAYHEIERIQEEKQKLQASDLWGSA